MFKMVSMLNRWNNEYKNSLTQYGRRSYGAKKVYELAAAFLDGHGDVEDWGGGLAYFKRYIKKSNYICIDGTMSKYCDKHIDLEEYRTKTDCILLRSVIEHNYNWKQVLSNAIDSFGKRMVLVIYTPFVDEENIISVDPQGRPIISLVKKEIEEVFRPDVLIVKEDLVERSQPFSREHIYFLEKKGIK